MEIMTHDDESVPDGFAVMGPAFFRDVLPTWVTAGIISERDAREVQRIFTTEGLDAAATYLCARVNPQN